jgi:hypothetical protein
VQEEGSCCARCKPTRPAGTAQSVLSQLAAPAQSPTPPLQAYLAGDWSDARRWLEACLHARRDASGRPLVDGPSQTLLEVMAGHQYRAPSSWASYRELTEK